MRRERLHRLARRLAPADGRAAKYADPLVRMLLVNRGSNLATLRFACRHGLTVLDGPFAGLRYPRAALFHIGGLATYLGGTYEAELHTAVEDLVGSQPPLIVNVGAGDGYYAAGLALRCPAAKVLAYEADQHAAEVCEHVLRVNGLSGRVELRGTCTAAALAEVEAPAGSAVVCDCEGAEAEIIEPERVPWLRSASVLVEVHETFVPGVENRLRERLRRTHRIETLRPAKRYIEDHPAFWDTRGASLVQLEMLVAELRPWRTSWLWARPR